MENGNLSNSEKLKNSLCYIPLGGIVLFFTEETKSKILIKNIKYGTYLFFAFIFFQFIIVGIFMIPIGSILFLIYAGITGFLGWKAYNGEDINIEYIDELEKKIKDNLNDDRIVKKENVSEIKKEDVIEKKEDKKEEKKDDDISNF